MECYTTWSMHDKLRYVEYENDSCNFTLFLAI